MAYEFGSPPSTPVPTNFSTPATAPGSALFSGRFAEVLDSHYRRGAGHLPRCSPLALEPPEGLLLWASSKCLGRADVDASAVDVDVLKLKMNVDVVIQPDRVDARLLLVHRRLGDVDLGAALRTQVQCRQPGGGLLQSLRR